MLFLYFFLLFAASESVFARSRGDLRRRNGVMHHGIFRGSGSHGGKPRGVWRRNPLKARTNPPSSGSGGCHGSDKPTAKAPKTNIFLGLSDDEAAGVTQFLHGQKDLNLTAAADSTPWDNKILLVELLIPNKTDALPYLESTGDAPKRYARTVLRFGTTTEPYIQEYQVGPLPVDNATTTYTELNYLYNKGRGRQRLYDLDVDALEEYVYGIGAKIADITKQLLGGVAEGGDDDTLAIASATPLEHEGNKVYEWNQIYTLHTGACASEDLLPTGLIFKSDITGRDPAKWAVKAFQFNGIYYDSEAKFRAAINSTGFVNPGKNEDGPWACTDWNNETLPYDILSPPVAVQPDGARFALDEQEKYVEWMGFSFYFTSTRDRGLQLYDIKFKGDRIIYELGLNEAMAHYASASDPFQATNAYLDTEYGMGATAWQLVQGYDCPSHATYINSSYYVGETSHVHPGSICLFEMDTGYPIQRHVSAEYVSISKDIMFTLRQTSTVGNYDYIFDYEFYLDGSIHVTVRASGYIQSSFWASGQGGDDGYHIHDRLLGSMHDHVLSYKVDMDVNGTANSLVQASLVPVTETYPWSNGKPRNTMKFERKYIENENGGKLNWDYNNAIMYSVVNKDAKNPYGEYRGYKILPATGQRNHLVAKDSSILGPSANWADHHLYALQRHDTEPYSNYPFNGFDPYHPVIDFHKYFNGESLDQEDLVLYFNLGMHHIPDTSDIPNTLFSTAQSGMIISPQNFLLGDASRSSRHNAHINIVNGSVTNAETNGINPPTCSYDLTDTAPKVNLYTGEVYIPKYPYHPDSQMLGNPGDGTQQGVR